MVVAPLTVNGQDVAIGNVLGYPDMIVHNARIVTMDDASFSSSPGTIAEAMVIRDDKILAIGSDEDMLELAGPDTQRIDLGGRTVLPGFILTHEHPTDWAWTEPVGLNYVFPPGNEHMVVHFMDGDAEYQLANWEDELQAAVSKASPGQWILFSSDWGGNFEHMPELFPKFLPQISRERLDELAPDNPVRVKNSWVDGLVNTRALEEAKRVFPDQRVEGRGNRGPTGRQLEPDVMLHGKVELNAELLKAQMELWAAHGVTLYGSSPYTIGNLKALRMLDEQGRMPRTFRLELHGTGPALPDHQAGLGAARKRHRSPLEHRPRMASGPAAIARRCRPLTGSSRRKTAGSNPAMTAAASRKTSFAAVDELPQCTPAATRTSITCSMSSRNRVQQPDSRSRRSGHADTRSTTLRGRRAPTRSRASRSSA